MERTRRGGGRGASHEDTPQFRSVETNGGDAALTPTPQTALRTSPGEHKMIDRFLQVVKHIILPGVPLPWTYLEVIDVVLSVQVNTHGFLFDRHDGEADVYATMNLPFLNLCKIWLLKLAFMLSSHGEQ